MTVLAWDQVGSRIYRTGVDRGVLYLSDGLAHVWNGLTSVEETTTSDITPFYVDGIKYLDRPVPTDFSGKLKALTYPDAFESLNGIDSYGDGVFIHDQSSHSFGLSYRTKIGNDIESDLGYVIHILYNVTATPDPSLYETLSDQTKPLEFSWTLVGRPEEIPGFRPTAHISFKTTDMSQGNIEALEGILYGSESGDPSLPSPGELLSRTLGEITITDNGGGTWTATGPDESITMTSVDEFRITEANATYIDADTYEISSTDP